MEWMGNLSEAAKNKKLSNLIIPGSHDSGAWYLDASGPLAPNEPDILKLFKNSVYNWSITQDVNFSQQLSFGVRYFDLRVAPHPDTHTFNFVHGLYGKKVEEGLQEINDFLTSHPSEVVVLDFKQLLEFGEGDDTKLIDIILNCFDGKLAKKQTSFHDVTLHQLNQDKSQVIAIYHHSNTSEYLWNPSLIHSPWPNVQDIESLINFLNKELAFAHQGMFVHQGVLTPTLGTILKNFTGTLKSWETGAEKAVLDWVQSIEDKSNLNIVLRDFVTQEFCDSVIKCN